MSEQAIRLPTPEPGKFPYNFSTGRISYWQRHDGVWMLYMPAGGLGDLSNHTVTEHGDGTITVSPSILLTSTRPGKRRHGFLREGVWHPCGDDIPSKGAGDNE